LGKVQRGKGKIRERLRMLEETGRSEPRGQEGGNGTENRQTVRKGPVETRGKVPRAKKGHEPVEKWGGWVDYRSGKRKIQPPIGGKIP